METPTSDMDVAREAQQGLLARNLQALRLIGSDLPDRLSRVPPGELIPLSVGAAGRLSGRVRCDDGAEVLLASARDPQAEARRWLDELDGLDDSKHAVAVLGCGLGYHVAELLRRRAGGLVVVLETSPAVLQAALRCQDFVRDLLARRLVLLLLERRADLFEPLVGHNVELILGTLLATHPASTRAHPQAFSQAGQLITEYLDYVRASMATALGISAASMDNVLQNLPAYLGWPGIEDLRDAWKGRPAICVAAGPSLRKNMHLLAGLRGRAAVLAVQTVLKPLLAAGIRPDFVTALDYSPISRRFYDGLDGVDDVTLVADPKVSPVVPDGFPGPKRLFHHEFAARVLDELGERRDALPGGSTVAHLSFYLAEYLGCDPIILVGQDLGFEDNVYYAPGNPIHTTWSAELNRFNTLEMMEWQRIARMGKTLRQVPGRGGRMIWTDGQMFTYIQQFERDIAAAGVTVINATEGGAHLAGTREMSLAEAIERHCPADPAPALPPPARPRADAAERVGRGADCIRARLGELDRMDEICRNVLEPLCEMTAALDDPPRFNRLHRRMDTWRQKIDELERIYRLVADVAQLAEMRRFQLDHQRQRRSLGVVDQRRAELTRDIQYITLLREGVAMLRRSMERALARLEEAR